MGFDTEKIGKAGNQDSEPEKSRFLAFSLSRFLSFTEKIEKVGNQDSEQKNLAFSLSRCLAFSSLRRLQHG